MFKSNLERNGGLPSGEGIGSFHVRPSNLFVLPVGNRPEFRLKGRIDHTDQFLYDFLYRRQEAGSKIHGFASRVTTGCTPDQSLDHVIHEYPVDLAPAARKLGQLHPLSRDSIT